MTTRAVIKARDRWGSTAILYRHNDGYPQGVISDIKVFIDNYHDKYGDLHGVEYWLANFMFYAKLTCLVEQYKWFEKEYKRKKIKDHQLFHELGYGILSDGKIPSDVEYIYELDLLNERIKIIDTYENKVIFDGSLTVSYTHLTLPTN